MVPCPLRPGDHKPSGEKDWELWEMSIEQEKPKPTNKVILFGVFATLALLIAAVRI